MLGATPPAAGNSKVCLTNERGDVVLTNDRPVLTHLTTSQWLRFTLYTVKSMITTRVPGLEIVLLSPEVWSLFKV